MKPKISEKDKDYYCRLICHACDGDLTQTDTITGLVREVWTVWALRYIADQLTVAGYEW